jgi:hypothetical protein
LELSAAVNAKEATRNTRFLNATIIISVKMLNSIIIPFPQIFRLASCLITSGIFILLMIWIYPIHDNIVLSN